MYEIFEHTADLGLRIRSSDLDGLFEEAAVALFSMIVTNLDQVRPVEQTTFKIEGDRQDDLLRDWLGELLYAFHGDHLLFSRFDVRVDRHGLTATARGEPYQPDRHELQSEIKAVTYHGLKVERVDDGWLAEVIVDI